MPVALDATAGGAAANSYLTATEADAYFETRLFSDAWEDASKDKALMMASRLMDTMAQPGRVLVIEGGSRYFRSRPTWTGTPATAIQALAWPRAGMLDMNGNAIAENVIPQRLKDAVAELAFQLSSGGDRTLDSDLETQGISSLRAGSVSLSFRDGVRAKVIPDAVMALLVPSWLTADLIEYEPTAIFEVLDQSPAEGNV